MEMTSISCEIGHKPRRHSPCHIISHWYAQAEFGYIPSDILGAQNIRRPTLDLSDTPHVQV